MNHYANISSVPAETNGLILSFKNGKTEAFNRLIELHEGKIYRTVYALLGSRQDAEEVVQDAFIRAYRALDAFRGDSSFETWMHRIAVNLARNKFHWNRRRGDGINLSISGLSTDEEKDMAEFLLPDERMRPDRALENAETESRIFQGIRALPVTLREAMVLRHVHDLPYDQIADRLQCKVGTVKSRLARGRSLLKKYLQSGE